MKTPRPRRVTWVTASVATLAVAVWAWVAVANQETAYVNDNSSSGQSDLRIGLTTFDNATRTAAPTIAGSTLGGDSYSLVSERGHLVVVNVWASWCRPCRAETPELVRLARAYHSRGVRFIGIDTRDDTAAARRFVSNYAVPYPSIIDDGDIVGTLRDLVPVAAVPSTIVIDERGSVAARIIGRARYQVLRQILETELVRTTAGVVS